MENEREISSFAHKLSDIFGFTEQEHLRWCISQGRFDEIFADEETIVHKVKVSSNNFSEILFVATSRSGEQGRVCITFYGLGYHEYRVRWIINEWYWFQTNSFPNLLRKRYEKAEA